LQWQCLVFYLKRHAFVRARHACEGRWVAGRGRRVQVRRLRDCWPRMALHALLPALEGFMHVRAVFQA
jgi:hypothetical protein